MKKTFFLTILILGFLPLSARKTEVLYLSGLDDQYGRNINTWSWNITQPEDFVSRLVVTNQDSVMATEIDTLLILSSGKTVVTFNKKSGLIADIKNNNKTISFGNGLQFAGFTSAFKEMKYYNLENKYVIELSYENACHAVWTMLPGGWLQLDYEYRPNGLLDFAGITFSYPENLVAGATLLANGPYHVWKNRLKGTLYFRFGE